MLNVLSDGLNKKHAQIYIDKKKWIYFLSKKNYVRTILSEN